MFGHCFLGRRTWLRLGRGQLHVFRGAYRQLEPRQSAVDLPADRLVGLAYSDLAARVHLRLGDTVVPMSNVGLRESTACYFRQEEGPPGFALAAGVGATPWFGRPFWTGV